MDPSFPEFLAPGTRGFLVRERYIYGITDNSSVVFKNKYTVKFQVLVCIREIRIVQRERGKGTDPWWDLPICLVLQKLRG